MNSSELDQYLEKSLEQRESHQGLAAMCEHSPPKQSVRWGCLCAWSIWRPVPPEQEDQALSIACQWVGSDADEQRINAFQAIENNQDAIGTWLLKAVVNSGGTLAIPDQPAELPTPDFAGRFVNGYVQHLLAQVPTEQKEVTAQTFVQLARQSISDPIPSV